MAQFSFVREYPQRRVVVNRDHASEFTISRLECSGQTPPGSAGLAISGALLSSDL